MVTIQDFVARIEGTCGKDKDIIVIFKYDKKDEAIAKILKRAKVEKSISAAIYELTFQNVSFRLYTTGKAIFRSLKEKSELEKILTDLLL